MEEQMYVVYLDYYLGGYRVDAGKLIKKTPNGCKVGNCPELSYFPSRQILNDKNDNYAIVDKDTANMVHFFGINYNKIARETLNALRKQTQKSILELMNIAKARQNQLEYNNKENK